MWTCTKCRIGFTTELIEDHIYKNHFKTPEIVRRKTYICGECTFKSAEGFQQIGLHCLVTGHRPSLVTVHGHKHDKEYLPQLLKALDEMILLRNEQEPIETTEFSPRPKNDTSTTTKTSRKNNTCNNNKPLEQTFLSGTQSKSTGPSHHIEQTFNGNNEQSISHHHQQSVIFTAAPTSQRSPPVASADISPKNLSKTDRSVVRNIFRSVKEEKKWYDNEKEGNNNNQRQQCSSNNSRSSPFISWVKTENANANDVDDVFGFTADGSSDDDEDEANEDWRDEEGESKDVPPSFREQQVEEEVVADRHQLSSLSKSKEDIHKNMLNSVYIFPSSSSLPSPADDKKPLLSFLTNTLISSSAIEVTSPENDMETSCRSNDTGSSRLTDSSSATTKKTSQCSFCPRLLSSNLKRRAHEMIHTGQKAFECDVCRKSFALPHTLKVHRRVHTGVKPFTCTVCGGGFGDVSKLKIHARMHTGEKPYACPTCDKRFKGSSEMIVHQRIHSGERPFRCSFCQKAFRASGEVKRHERIHTGEKPYSCTFCDRRFRIATGLLEHKRTAHTGEKPFICPVCQKAYATSSRMTTHQRRTHKNKLTPQK